MPKKHRNTLHTKPSSTAPATFAGRSSSKTTAAPQNGNSTSSSTRSSSVNDLISHFRRTQINNDTKPVRVPKMPTVHPSLRNLLDIPETPPPRARPGTRLSVRARRIPGPPPPNSWLTASQHAPPALRKADRAAALVDGVFQQDSNTLPGARFPSTGSLQDLALRSVAKHLPWHLENDGLLLATMPLLFKETLLSYSATHSFDTSANLVSKLFPSVAEWERSELDGIFELPSDTGQVTRLDLTGAIGPWLSMKQLSRELVLPTKGLQMSTFETTTASNAANDPEATLDCWETEATETTDSPAPSIPAAPTTPSRLRFSSLLHLSLALSPSARTRHSSTSATWPALLSLTTHLSTLTSLSLAYWPLPTLQPRASSTYTTTRPTTITRSLPLIPYGGSDIYTALDGLWSEAAGVLKTLSRNLYCLTWLDVSGCGEWVEALAKEEGGVEWNGGWRGVEWVGMGVGWYPADLENPEESPNNVGGSTHKENGVITQDWDVEIERAKYYRKQNVQSFVNLRLAAESVAHQIREIRKKGKGRWINFDLGREISDARF